MRPLRIGVTYDLKDDYPGLAEEDIAEFDVEETIAAICEALTGLGFDPVRIGNAKKLVEALARGERWDGVFNLCEGLKGLAREALAPALLEAYDIPFVFSDALTLALALDKAMAKRVVRACGVPTADFAVIETLSDIKRIVLPYPLFLKPVAEGSGKGVDGRSKVDSATELKATASALLARFAQPVLVETFLSGREFTVGITGTGADASVLGVSEYVPTDKFVGHGYGFENKEYWQDKLSIRPVRDAQGAAAAKVALDAWRALRCRDGGRVDIRNDARGAPHFIEVNPLAGMRPGYSDLCFICDFEGITYPELIGKFMASFLKRYPALRQ